MNVYDQAHGLAHAIKASEEYKQYDEAKKKLKEKVNVYASDISKITKSISFIESIYSFILSQRPISILSL